MTTRLLQQRIGRRLVSSFLINFLILPLFNCLENELAKLDGTYCPNANDKYQLLLKRDTLLAKLRTKSTNLKQATQFLVSFFTLLICCILIR